MTVVSTNEEVLKEFLLITVYPIAEPAAPVPAPVIALNGIEVLNL